MGGQADVTDHALPLQILHIGNGSMLDGGFQIRRLINTMDQSEVDVIRPQGFQLPVNRALDFVQVQRPAIFPAAVIRTK